MVIMLKEAATSAQRYADEILQLHRCSTMRGISVKHEEGSSMLLVDRTEGKGRGGELIQAHHSISAVVIHKT